MYVPTVTAVKKKYKQFEVLSKVTKIASKMPPTLIPLYELYMTSKCWIK